MWTPPAAPVTRTPLIAMCSLKFRLVALVWMYWVMVKEMVPSGVVFLKRVTDPPTCQHACVRLKWFTDGAQVDDACAVSACGPAAATRIADAPATATTRELVAACAIPPLLT